MTTSSDNQKSRNGASRLGVFGSGGKRLEFVLLGLVAVAALIITMTLNDDAAFTFVIGNLSGFAIYRLVTAREHFILNRFRHVLTQYAGLNHPVGDQARDALREEREGGH